MSRELLLEARKRHNREKSERKKEKQKAERKERKKKEKENLRKREEKIREKEEKIRKREQKIRKREKREKREKERAALASPVTPARTLKVKDVRLYLSATKGPLCRSNPSSPSGPSGPLVSPGALLGPPTPNLSARRLPSSSLGPGPSGSSSQFSRVQKQPPSSRSFGSPLSPSFPETPRRSLLSPQHLRQRITESLQASPLGRIFAPSKKEVVVSDLEVELDLDDLED